MERQPRVIGYVRASTERQGRSGLGMDAQERLIRSSRIGALDGAELVIVRETGSGGSLDRPGLTEALASLEAGDTLVVAKLDRLARSVIGLGALIKRAQSEGWNLVALDFGMDLSTPNGRLVAHILGAVAEWERETIGERTAAALAEAKRRGKQVGAKREVDEETVRLILAAREAGSSLRQIAAMLTSEGILTPRGGRTWSLSSVQHVYDRYGDG